jgi:hypothetical protein
MLVFAKLRAYLAGFLSTAGFWPKMDQSLSHGARKKKRWAQTLWLQRLNGSGSF